MSYSGAAANRPALTKKAVHILDRCAEPHRLSRFCGREFELAGDGCKTQEDSVTDRGLVQIWNRLPPALMPPSHILPHALQTPVMKKLTGKRIVLASASPRRKDILSVFVLGLSSVIVKSTDSDVSRDLRPTSFLLHSRRIYRSAHSRTSTSIRSRRPPTRR